MLLIFYFDLSLLGAMENLKQAGLFLRCQMTAQFQRKDFSSVFYLSLLSDLLGSCSPAVLHSLLSSRCTLSDPAPVYVFRLIFMTTLRHPHHLFFPLLCLPVIGNYLNSPTDSPCHILQIQDLLRSLSAASVGFSSIQCRPTRAGQVRGNMLGILRQNSLRGFYALILSISM